jgi:hypothetical protein
MKAHAIGSVSVALCSADRAEPINRTDKHEIKKLLFRIQLLSSVVRDAPRETQTQHDIHNTHDEIIASHRGKASKNRTCNVDNLIYPEISYNKALASSPDGRKGRYG